MADLLDLTLRQVVERLLQQVQEQTQAIVQAQVQAHDWVNIRTDNYPWRQLVAAAERGECQVHRWGRKLMMRREELDKVLPTHPISPKQEPEVEKPKDEFQDSLQRALRRHGVA